ncbi:transporter substrate-binding domain-containing protein [Vibrio sp. OCN044]|uniref:Transporter substrate-binding domain-containing protein n=1 Tax=Vibrio tetraodonis subsp. pristinus TaxID=2695891 RepID=A0A6L8LPY7_9VIBR|nr:transporter substrate-binding domain-containing protein [Vibrio tetraodonis]MYM58124.1 transporter substrate-binding domain-containing protein [Vibrio tetraodonis subsp. pristinus]
MKWLLLCWLGFIPVLVAASNKVYMTSLDWPPYSGENLRENGYSIAIAREAFSVMGYELIVDFEPWVRAVSLATKSEKYIGYFPEYFFDTQDFIFSDSIGSGPLGLVENSNFPVTWSKLVDLKTLRIGVVQGYVNTKEFDDMVANGELDVEASSNDTKNIHKVAKRRLDAAVIDSNVLEHLISEDSQEAFLRQHLQMNTRLLDDKQIYVAFRNEPKGVDLKRIFNQGLEKIDIESIIHRLSKPTDADDNMAQ